MQLSGSIQLLDIESFIGGGTSAWVACSSVGSKAAVVTRFHIFTEHLGNSHWMESLRSEARKPYTFD